MREAYSIEDVARMRSLVQMICPDLSWEKQEAYLNTTMLAGISPDDIQKAWEARKEWNERYSKAGKESLGKFDGIPDASARREAFYTYREAWMAENPKPALPF